MGLAQMSILLPGMLLILLAGVLPIVWSCDAKPCGPSCLPR